MSIFAPPSTAGPPLSSEEQTAIANLGYNQKLEFADYLLDNHTDGPDYYDGWGKTEFMEALFAGPDAFRAVLAFVLTKR